MTANSLEGLVARATALMPMLREQAAANETSRRLSPEVFDTLSEADVFRMTAPKRRMRTKPKHRSRICRSARPR
jgi:hypothetical protein